VYTVERSVCIMPTSDSGQKTSTVTMNPGLSTMLMHRRQTTVVTHIEHKKDRSIYILEDGTKIICFLQSIKKSDVLSMIHESETVDIKLTGPSISRPASLLAEDNNIEIINDDLYAFDRMESNLMPTYTTMTSEEIACMESKHKCPRTQWPRLCETDPLALYLGIKRGTCVFVCDISGIINVRHVV
jgi:DNA-directed RNA polymerase subunit H (RpoH/RPB5)